MIRLNRKTIPSSIRAEGRVKELLGEVKNNTVPDCVYNSIVFGEVDDSVAKIAEEQLKMMLPELPAGKKLKPHQIKDLCRSVCTPLVFNINKPGKGKTLETILWIRLVLKKDFKALILCPKSVIGTWQAQLEEYWPGYLDCGTWWITNYEQLYNTENFATAKSFTWDVIVLDESHKIKSMKSKINDIVFELKSDARHCLTGTPIKNRPQDLAAQLKWLDQTSITNFTDFQFAFCDMQKDHWGWQPKGLTKNKTMVENLQKLLNLYCVGDNDDVPCEAGEPEYIKVRLKLDPKVKALYSKVEGEYDEATGQRVIDTEGLLEEGIKVSSAIEAATRRQQLASNPQLFNPQLKNVKFEWILDWIDGTDEKVVIFSKYAKTIEELERLFVKQKVSHICIKREHNAALRKNLLKQWQKEKQVLMGTFGVLGEGVDGIQDYCHYAIFIDREWTASANEQAEGRIVRTGQKYQPIIYILQGIGTIDVQIERIQLDKGHDARELLGHISDEE